jgi:hypothetical protein
MCPFLYPMYLCVSKKINEQVHAFAHPPNFGLGRFLKFNTVFSEQFQNRLINTFNDRDQ